MSRELKQERSIPVQGRVDIKSLAELDCYWASIGVDIRSMSQLISWSVDALHSIISKNEQMPKKFETVADCHAHLEIRRLYQGSMKRRSMAKVSAAMRMENLRFEGADPAINNDREYKMVHNRHSVQPLPDSYRNVSDEEYERVMGMTRKQARKVIENPHSIKVYDQNNQPEIDMDKLLNKHEEEEDLIAKNTAKYKKVDKAVANMSDLPVGEPVEIDDE